MPHRKVYDLIFKKQISTKVDNSSLLNKQGYASTSQFIERSYVLNEKFKHKTVPSKIWQVYTWMFLDMRLVCVVYSLIVSDSQMFIYCGIFSSSTVLLSIFPAHCIILYTKATILSILSVFPLLVFYLFTSFWSTVKNCNF